MRYPPRPSSPPRARPAHAMQTNNFSDFNKTHTIPLLMDSDSELESESESGLDKRCASHLEANRGIPFAFVARYWRLRATKTFRWCSVYLGYLRHLRYFLINFHRRLPTASGQSFDVYVLLTTSRLKWGFAFESFFFAVCRWLFVPIRNELKQVNQRSVTVRYPVCD